MDPDKLTKLPFLKESNEIVDLDLKSVPELQELLERQNNLLKTKFVLDKLKDKGEKMKNFKARIEEELKSREARTVSKENVININAWEWRDPNKERQKNKNENIEDIESNENVLQMLAENGNIPTAANSKFKNTPHVKKLIETEHEQKFTFKPYIAVVDRKLKKIIPEAHVEEKCSGTTKYIDLTESMDLLTEQFSTLKCLENISKSKRAEECIEDRIIEFNLENSDNEGNDECIIND